LASAAMVTRWEAIDRVEVAFGILFNHADCEAFVTVGDVWRALLVELQLDEASQGADAAWPQFVRALGDETLQEHRFLQVGCETRLIL
jgi:hypothetical protein